MFQNSPPKFSCYSITSKTAQKLERSAGECVNLSERVLSCPYCGFTICSVFEDTGHIRVKCPKCKASMVMNTAYFRKQHDRLGCDFYNTKR